MGKTKLMCFHFDITFITLMLSLFRTCSLLDEMPQNYRRPPSPPPSYEEVAKVKLENDKHNLKGSFGQQQQQQLLKPKPDGEEKRMDELPPEYSAAVAMTPNLQQQQLLCTSITPVL